MENKKSIRNPLPKIAKIFKYEMLHTARILGPIYITVIALAFIASLFLSSDASEKGFFANFTVSSATGHKLSGIFAFFYVVTFIGVGVASVSILAKRFKCTMLEDEAYLNLSLPVTIGEHLLGRILVSIVWIIAYIPTNIITFSLLFMKDSKDLSQTFSESALKPILLALFIFVTTSLLLIVFIYMINAIAHLAKRHRNLVKFVAVILIISINSKFFTFVSELFFNSTVIENDIYMFIESCYFIGIFNTIMIIIYSLVTYLILKFRLNLE
ncbi:MAG: hypothetical protein J6X84_07010 [Treponema sp.]|nr:hypothetical protein [Treponema sp.]